MKPYHPSAFQPFYADQSENSPTINHTAVMWLGSQFVLFHVMMLFAFQNYQNSPRGDVYLSLGQFYGGYVTSHALLLFAVVMSTPLICGIIDWLAQEKNHYYPTAAALPRLTKVHKSHLEAEAFQEDEELLKIEQTLVKLAAENRVHMPTPRMKESLEVRDRFEQEWDCAKQTLHH